jgi:hypothetical protein
MTLGDIKGHKGDFMGLLRLTFKGKGKTPLGLGLPSCLWWNVLLSLFGASLWYMYAPGWGLNIHLVGFIPMEV